jgi:hypothetical protein
MENQKEIWKTIDGYKNYQVSNLGNVRSLNYRRSGLTKVLNPIINSTGYYNINLYLDGVSNTRQVHQLVAIAFLGHTPCGFKFVVNHKNFIKTDNRLTNLEIVTNRENCNLKHIKSTSKYIGVYWNKRLKKWQSQIQIKSKKIYLGLYIYELDAHNAYQNALKSI